MKNIWKLILAIAITAVCCIGISDESSAAEFPSADEIIDTVDFPDYSFDDFVEGAKYMFSDEMIKSMADYGTNLITFVSEDTFVKDIGEGNVSGDSFTGNYINIFVLLCLIIAIICVLSAVIGYIRNRNTYLKSREHL